MRVLIFKYSVQQQVDPEIKVISHIFGFFLNLNVIELSSSMIWVWGNEIKDVNTLTTISLLVNRNEASNDKYTVNQSRLKFIEPAQL